MTTMPSCPVCKTNEFVVSDGGFKLSAGAIIGGLLAGTVATILTGGVLLPAVMLGLGTVVGRKAGHTLEQTDPLRTYFCQRDGHKWTAAPPTS
jgi:hypothetical protein